MYALVTEIFEFDRIPAAKSRWFRRAKKHGSRPVNTEKNARVCEKVKFGAANVDEYLLRRAGTPWAGWSRRKTALHIAP